MEKILDLRQEIYQQFHGSRAGPDFFFLSENKNEYAAYYTAMYLIQDTGEAVWWHMGQGFSSEPMHAYIEFWGVLQAICIQQDAIDELHKAVIGSRPGRVEDCAWKKIRDLRIRCAGHPANRSRDVPGPQRTFLGRRFGNYNAIKYELWDSSNSGISHPVVDLRTMIDQYDDEAAQILTEVLSAMKSRWPCP
ncbi:MAG: hypothetical protein HC900_07330 [Methylacidiphilales bacterium]|nr:hypothetical protein [Candidatus Methylacidiphilales bacterium]